MSSHYPVFYKRLEENVYKHNETRRKKNQSNLHKTRNQLKKKLADGTSKQVKANTKKVEALDDLLSRIDAYGAYETESIPKKAEKADKGAKEEKTSESPKHPAVVKALIADFFKTLPTLTKKELEAAVQYLSDLYYNDGISLLSDENYDRLAERLKTEFGKEAGVGAEVEKHKVKLPYFMGSMDKLKPEKHNLASWLTRYPGKVCISDKLDGISALYVKEGGVKSLFTRGNGVIGQDIGHMLSHIQIGDLPAMERCVVRGELIVSKANYERVKEGKKGARQMVSGLANQKTLTADRIAMMRLIEFVAYEVIVPEALPPSGQFTLLDKHSTFHTAPWSTMASAVSIESLSEVLTERKTASAYEIDGIIVAHDAVYPRVAGKNPEHAFAFKMSFAEQQATTEVIAVLWEASKDGYLKPTVQFEPVNISGVTIQYATGFNAAFIHNNGIGPGAFLDIVRSGDVIPYIKKVQSPSATGPQMPAGDWHWNETHVDAVRDDISGNAGVQKRILLYFAQTLEIAFCGEGNITKLFAAGIRTIPQLVHVKESEITSRFAPASAKKLVESVQAAVAKATVVEWAVGSSLFGRGIGTKRLLPAFAVVAEHRDAKDLLDRIAAIDGWSRASATGFVERLPAFEAFLKTIGIVPRLKTPPAKRTGPLSGAVVLFTGFHPADLEALVVAKGGEVADTWSKKVTLLVIKDATVSNEKTKKAATAGVPVLVADEFRAKHT
jgi:DNA ligase (NAD+)